MSLNLKAKEHFDTVASDLVSSLLPLTSPVKSDNSPSILSSSYKPVDIINLADLGAKLGILKTFEHDSGELCQIHKYIEEQGFVGLSDSSIEKFNKLVNGIYKLSTWVSYNKLQDLIFTYIIERCKNPEYPGGVCDYILEWKEENVRTYNFYFVVKGVAIESPFPIGNTWITYHTKESIDKIISECKHTPTEWEVERMKDAFIGNTTVLCGVEGYEAEKAAEVSRKMGELTLDVLKLYSDAVLYPNRFAGFDIDFRYIEEGRSEDRLILTVGEDKLPISASLGFGRGKNSPQSFQITKDYVKKMEKENIGILHQLLIAHDKGEINELQNLAIEAIRRFADALSNQDIHKRITEIFTSFESLILKNSNVGIIDSLKKYIPMLLSKDKEVKSKIKSNLKEMYEIRSDFMHHGKRRKVDFAKLRLLQWNLRALILVISRESKKFSTKDEMLKTIDDALDSASIW